MAAVLGFACTGCWGSITGTADSATDTGAGDTEGDTSPDGAADTTVDPDDTAGDTAAEGDGCVEQTWYQDVDHDGFGDPATTAFGCEPPPGYAAVGGDCNDVDPIVSPGQFEWFTDPTTAGGFDYNCDGIEEQRYLAIHHCSMFDCVDGEGWNEDAAPACGERGSWVSCSHVGMACVYNPSTRTQECH